MNDVQANIKTISSRSWPITPWLYIVGIIGADQVTKYILEANLSQGGKISLISGFFDIVHIKNRGAAFGMFSDAGEWTPYILATINIIALGVITLLYRTTPTADKVTRGAFVIIAAGAIGNLIDRIRYGEVTDFLLFYIGAYQWPAFNVADSCITIGVALLVWRTLIKPYPADEAPTKG